MAVRQWTRQEKFKRGVWAVAFAACIFAGTITGAQLKTDNEKKEVKWTKETPKVIWLITEIGYSRVPGDIPQRTNNCPPIPTKISGITKGCSPKKNGRLRSPCQGTRG
jgi:hypothetical protein